MGGQFGVRWRGCLRLRPVTCPLYSVLPFPPRHHHHWPLWAIAGVGDLLGASSFPPVIYRPSPRGWLFQGSSWVFSLAGVAGGALPHSYASPPHLRQPRARSIASEQAGAGLGWAPAGCFLVFSSFHRNAWGRENEKRRSQGTYLFSILYGTCQILIRIM